MIIQILINGVLLGGIYGLIGLGFSLVWGVTNLINLAHGSLVILGAYATFWIFHFLHIDPFISIPIVMVALFIVGYFMQRYIFNLAIKADVFLTLIMTFGMDVLLAQLMIVMWSADWRSIATSYQGKSFIIGEYIFPYTRILGFVAATILTILTAIFLNRTKTGQSIRAVALDMMATRLMGVNPGKTYAITFGIGTALAGAAGSLISVIQSFNPAVGGGITLRAFVVAILGGLGSVEGAFLGGIILGIIETFSAFYLGESFKNVVTFTLFVIILVTRPRGLLGKKYYG